MDKFVQYTGQTCAGQDSAPGLVMDYYDGNTVTALWNYAQRFAMSDNSFGTTFGPSTPGALNLVCGQTHGVSSVGQDRSRPPPRPVHGGLPRRDRGGHGHRRPGPGLRRLLEHQVPAGRDERQEHR